jgi:hypothetical protein
MSKRQDHPYRELEDSALWKVIERAVRDLTKNGDLKEATARAYIVGYISKLVRDAGFQQVSQLKTGPKVIHVVEVAQPRMAKAS